MPIERLPDTLRKLPILTSSREQLLAQRMASVRTVGHIVDTDPLLAWQLLRFFQRQLKEHGRPALRIPTLNQALMMTGLESFVDEMRRHPTVKVNDSQTHLIRQEAMRAAHAARFAEYFGQQRNDLEPEELMTSALLWRLPTLANLIEGGSAFDTVMCGTQINAWAINDEAFPELLATHTAESERWQLVSIAHQLADTLDECGWNTSFQHALEERAAQILDLNIESLHRALVNRSIVLAQLSMQRYHVRPLLATIIWD